MFLWWNVSYLNLDFIPHRKYKWIEIQFWRYRKNPRSLLKKFNTHLKLNTFRLTKISHFISCFKQNEIYSSQCNLIVTLVSQWDCNEYCEAGRSNAREFLPGNCLEMRFTLAIEATYQITGKFCLHWSMTHNWEWWINCRKSHLMQSKVTYQFGNYFNS